MRTNFAKKLAIIGGVVVIVAVILIIVTVVLTKDKQSDGINKAAVVTNGYGCAEIGTDILQKGGNAVDAAIASLFCEGVSMPQSMGLGGGFIMTLYNKTTKETWFLNARETAPSKATLNMFHGKPELAQKGGLSVAVPGELRGYWELYHRFGGGVPWKDLIQPTIEMCKNGILVTSFLDSVFKSSSNMLYADPILRESFWDPTTNKTLVKGQYVKRLRLAKTLEIIAKDGGNALYNGSLVEGFVKDVRNKGGILTVEDMQSYKIEWMKTIDIKLPKNRTLHTTPLPGSGPVLGMILNLINAGNVADAHSLLTYQYLVETFKFTYGARTKLGDPNFVVNMSKYVDELLSAEYTEKIKSQISLNSTQQDPAYYGAEVASVEDHGTAHLQVISKEGDAVAVTSTVNLLFGAGFASESTGIILNDEMDDFSSPNISNKFGLPPSPANFIVPGKTPLSSMCPSLITDENGDVIMAIGAAGGSKITSAVALTILNKLWYGMDVKTAIDRKRFHHQLFPMAIILEPDFASDSEGKLILDGLTKIGHNVTYINDKGFAAVTAISRNSGTDSLSGASDKRRSGSISYIK